MTVIFKHEEPQLIPERAGMLANEVENNNDTCKAQGSSKPRVSWMVCGHSWSANGPLWGSLEGTNQWTSPAFFQAKQNVRLMIGTPYLRTNSMYSYKKGDIHYIAYIV